MNLSRFLRPRSGVQPAPAGRTAARLRFGLALAAALLIGGYAGLWLFFPTDVLRQRLEQEARTRGNVELRLGELSLLFPLGLKGHTVSIGSPRPPGASFAVDAVTVKPLWLTLFGSRPGAGVRAQLQGGEIEATVRRGGALEAELNQVPFAAPLVAGSPIALAGTVREGSFAGEMPVRPATATRLRLVAADVRLTGLEALGLPGGTLPLGTVTLQGSGQGNNLRVDQLTASGGRLEASGSGTVLLATPLERSRLNLTLTVRPGRDFDENLAGLLSIFGQREADGSYRLRLAGTLASPGAR